MPTQKRGREYEAVFHRCAKQKRDPALEGLSKYCHACGKEYTHTGGHCRGCQAPRPSLSRKCGNVEEDSYFRTILSIYRGVLPVCLVLLLCLLTIVVLQGIAIVHLRESHRVMTIEMRNHTEVLDLYYQCSVMTLEMRNHTEVLDLYYQCIKTVEI